MPPALRALMASSASSRVLPAMNRSATRRAIGLAVTCRCRNAEPAAISSVALSMVPTLPRHPTRGARPAGPGEARAPKPARAGPLDTDPGRPPLPRSVFRRLDRLLRLGGSWRPAGGATARDDHGDHDRGGGE